MPCPEAEQGQAGGPAAAQPHGCRDRPIDARMSVTSSTSRRTNPRLPHPRPVRSGTAAWRALATFSSSVTTPTAPARSACPRSALPRRFARRGRCTSPGEAGPGHAESHPCASGFPDPLYGTRSPRLHSIAVSVFRGRLARVRLSEVRNPPHIRSERAGRTVMTSRLMTTSDRCRPNEVTQRGAVPGVSPAPSMCGCASTTAEPGICHQYGGRPAARFRSTGSRTRYRPAAIRLRRASGFCGPRPASEALSAGFSGVGWTPSSDQCGVGRAVRSEQALLSASLLLLSGLVRRVLGRLGRGAGRDGGSARRGPARGSVRRPGLARRPLVGPGVSGRGLRLRRWRELRRGMPSRGR